MSVVGLFMVLVAVSGTLACDPQKGPAGESECVLLDRYDKYQCATCLTNAYAEEKSKGRYGCTGLNTKYCYHQCMVDKYDLVKGPVYRDCQCNPGRSLPQPSIILPASCYSPDGTDCDWYRQCLSRMFRCSSHSAQHSASYGEIFCRLYYDPTLMLNNQTVQWVNAVRRCFEVSLVPLLHLCQSLPTCNEVQTTPSQSLASCHQSPYQGPSVCNIPVIDWLRIFWTIRGSYLSSEFVEILKTSVSTAAKCGGTYGSYIGDRLYSIEIWLSEAPVGDCYGPTLSNDELAHAIVQHISSSLRWEQNSAIDWYVFAVDGPIQSPPTDTPGKGLKIQLFVEDRNDIGLNANSAPTSLRLNETISQLSDVIQQGLTGTLGYTHFAVTSLVKCTSGTAIDNGCRFATQLAAGPPVNFTSVTEPPPCPTTVTTTTSTVSTTTAAIVIGDGVRSGAQMGASVCFALWLFSVLVCLCHNA